MMTTASFKNVAADPLYWYTLTGWNLVDSSHHIDYRSFSRYGSELNAAAGVWNRFYNEYTGRGNIIRSSNSGIDVIIVDSYICRDNLNATACTYSNGKIELYTSHLDSYTYTQRQATIEHELGHALGLGHPVAADKQIMLQGRKNYTALSWADKDGLKYSISFYDKY